MAEWRSTQEGGPTCRSKKRIEKIRKGDQSKPFTHPHPSFPSSCVAIRCPLLTNTVDNPLSLNFDGVSDLDRSVLSSSLLHHSFLPTFHHSTVFYCLFKTRSLNYPRTFLRSLFHIWHHEFQQLYLWHNFWSDIIS